MTTFTGTIPTFTAGDTTSVPTNLNILRDALKGTSEAWTSYTHGWTGTLGNGTIVAKYMRVNKLVTFRIQLTWGSTTSHGASNQSFALPVAAHADYTANMHIGNGIALDNNVAAFNSITAGWLTSTSVFLLTSANTAVSNTVPWTWAQSDKLSISGTYETA
ncbi:hypothetical protein [uncultured Nocardioides sp.]|uniref:hypothetical protein n=1 Tax=uncultured Nocardioides sp. TaxID=198441 RepID=UPI002603B2FD|nr:hypothetical protein [uncultured Nocardioides sp.]HRD59387.1 hypothetical protein [Nocardioides sp.]